MTRESENQSQSQAVNLTSLTTYQAGVMQASINRILQKHSDEVLKPYGITKMQWLIIGTVLDSGDAGIRLTDLAKQLDTTLSYITTAVNLLESKGILARNENEEDSRSKYISINQSFLAQCEVIEATMRKSLRRTIYSYVDHEDLYTYLKVMYQLTRVDNS
ncbi:hypothetical protein CYG49_01485 [Candidatus Saccharibacteria bacterium]|nr:MAG: hypothetical protein CYG49_01485 [Candidatus Saccharibacteria bacterium]